MKDRGIALTAMWNVEVIRIRDIRHEGLSKSLMMTG